MATRKSTRKQTITETPFIETVQPSAAQTEEATFEELKASMKDLFKDLPSWKRILCAAITSIAVGTAAGYVGITIAGYLTVGAALMTGSMFLAWAIYILGYIVSMYMSYRFSSWSYNNVVDKTVDAKFFAARDWVTGLFSAKAPTTSTQGA